MIFSKPPAKNELKKPSPIGILQHISQKNISDVSINIFHLTRGRQLIV